MPQSLRLVDLEGNRNSIRLSRTPLASGADGTVYIAANDPSVVVKLYHDPQKDPGRPKKLRAMLTEPPKLPMIEASGKRYVQIAWPIGWIENGRGRFCGYAMPTVDLSHATSLENLLSRKARQSIGISESYGYRLTAAVNLASVVAELHRIGHYIIDLKPINLNVYTDTFYISVLDCDGFSINGKAGARFPAHQYSDGYICPEALQQRSQPQELTEEQDCFALAVILFRLFNQGLHPYQGVPVRNRKIPLTDGERIQQELYAYGALPNKLLKPSPWSIHEYLAESTHALFDRAFTTRHDRPRAREWKDHLQGFVSERNGIRVCSKNTDHLHFPPKDCGFCALEPLKVPPRATRRSPRRTKTQAPPRRVATIVPAGSGATHGTRLQKPKWVSISVVSVVVLVLIWFVLHGRLERKLLMAAASNRIDEAQALLEDGANVDARGNSGETPIYFAVTSGDLKLVRLLIRHGANPNGLYFKETMLATAIQRRDVEIARALIAAGANVNRATDSLIETPLELALKSDQLEIADLLLAYNADPTVERRTVNLISMRSFGSLRHRETMARLRQQTWFKKNEYSPLMVAAAHGNDELVAKLLRSGADVRYRAGDDKTAFDVAIERGHRSIALSVIDQFASKPAGDSDAPESETRNSLEHSYYYDEWLQLVMFQLRVDPERIEKSADEGDARAQYALGLANELAFNGKRDRERAWFWLKKAADSNLAAAQYQLGYAYENGTIIPQDLGQAVSWYRRAAEQGDARAQNSLGMMYLRGNGLIQDYQKAHSFFSKAAKTYPEARYHLAVLYEEGHLGKRDITRALTYYMKSADGNFSKAQMRLGELYMTGTYVPQDRPQARLWYERVLSNPKATRNERDISKRYWFELTQALGPTTGTGADTNNINDTER